MSGAIGAGVLGIPYAIAKVGAPLGIVAIIGVGLFTIGYNLTIGRMCGKVWHAAQLPGLAERYLEVGEVANGSQYVYPSSGLPHGLYHWRRQTLATLLWQPLFLECYFF